MNNKMPVDVATALDKLFQVVREEALANPLFARRLLEVTGLTVQFRADEALAAIDPVLIAGQGHDEFRKTFLSLKAAEVKKIGKSTGLFTAGEALPAPLPQLVDLLWARASERRRDLFPQSREAAE